MRHPLRLFVSLALGWQLAGCGGHNAADRMSPSQGHLMRATDPVVAPRPGQAAKGPGGLIPTAPMAAPQGAEVYTITVTDMPVRDLLFALSRDANMNIDIYPGINGRITLSAVNQTLPQILDRVAKQVDLRYEISNQTIVISPDRPYLKIYQVNYLNMSRSTQSSIRVSSQISTTEGDKDTPLGNTDNNQSLTTLTNQSSNKFWESLTQNVQLILNQTPEQEELGAGGGGGFEELDLGGGAEQGKGKNKNGGASSAVGMGMPNRPGIAAVNPEAGLLSVFASAAQHDRIQQLLEQVLENAQRQVLIESTVVEVSLSEQYQEGVDWNSITYNPLNIASGGALLTTNTLTSAVVDELPLFSLNFKESGSLGGVDATINALQQFGNVKVLSSPKIMALNNQTSILKVVENKVYFTLESSTAVSNTNSTTGDTTSSPLYNTKVHTVPVGLVMSVTPQISQDDIVTLNVRPTISSISDWEKDPNPGLKANNTLTGVTDDIDNQVPVIQVKEMESMLRVQSGQVAVMGGLMQDKVQDKDTSVPGLSDVPVLGKYLFNYEDDLVSKTELVIFIRPVIMTTGRPKVPANMAMAPQGPGGAGGWNGYSAPSAIEQQTLPPHQPAAMTPAASDKVAAPAARQEGKSEAKATPAKQESKSEAKTTKVAVTPSPSGVLDFTKPMAPAKSGEKAKAAPGSGVVVAPPPAAAPAHAAGEAVVPDDAAAIDEANSTISLAAPEGKKAAGHH